MLHEKTHIPIQKRAIRTREKIILSAINQFSKKGYHKTDAAKIAKGAGVATGTFYIYFKDKKEVLIEIIKQFYNDVGERVLTESVGRQGTSTDIKALVHFFVKAFYSAHEIAPDLHREVCAMILIDRDIEKAYRKEEKKVHQLIVSFLKEYQSHLRVSDLEAAAIMIFKLSDEIIHMVKINGAPIEEGRLIAELEDMLCQYLVIPQ